MMGCHPFQNAMTQCFIIRKENKCDRNKFLPHVELNPQPSHVPPSTHN